MRITYGEQSGFGVNCSSWEGRTGYINSKLFREAASRNDHLLFYLAGPPGMVAGVHRDLDEIGIPDNQIRYDM